MSGRFLPPDHAKGDAATIGGYMAVHGRPAAFEGLDGCSYSVAIEADRISGEGPPFGAYFMFLRWRRIGPQGVEGHLESDYLSRGDTADAAREALGRMRLEQVKGLLDELIARHREPPERPWWDVMREEGA
jgi:hypothetical protein